MNRIRSRVGANTAVVHLRLMRGRMLRFLAGQHVRLTPAGGQGADVSIASCPCDGMNLEFHFDARAGDPLSARAMGGFGKSQRFEIQGPRGRFILDEGSARPLLFLAADTAIAPIKSIIEHAINLELPQPMVLCWQSAAPDGHYLHNYFRSLGDALDDFRYLPVTGALDATTLAAVARAGGVDAYVAGPETFVSRCRELLLTGGLPENRLFVDALNRRPAPAPGAD